MYFKIYPFLITPQVTFCRLPNNTLLIMVSVKTKLKRVTGILYILNSKLCLYFPYYNIYGI